MPLYGTQSVKNKEMQIIAASKFFRHAVAYRPQSNFLGFVQTAINISSQVDIHLAS